MINDAKNLMFNAIINLFNTIIKLSAGIIFSFTPSIADSIYSFTDFVTDILDLFELKISNKKPTKQHPFGFGRIEYITNVFVGIVLLMLGIGIFWHSFYLENKTVNLFILIFIISSIILKSISIIKLEKTFNRNHSKTILMNIEDAKTDIFSSFIVLTVVVLSNFNSTIPILEKSSMIGSLIISILIIKNSFELLKENILILLGSVDNSEEYIDLITKEINQLNVVVSKIELIRYGNYYKVHLVLNLKPNMTIEEAKKIQNSVKKELKRMRKIKIKFVNIDLDVLQN